MLRSSRLKTESLIRRLRSEQSSSLNTSIERVAHVIVFHVTLRRVHVDGSNLRLLEPKAVNVILEPQTCWEEWRQTVTIIVGSDPAVHPPIIVGHDRAKVHQYIHVVQRIRIDLFLVAQEHLYVIECVDVVGPGPECLRNLDYRLGGNSSMVEDE